MPNQYSLNSNNVSDIVSSVDAWFDSNGLAGWDPYDLKGHPLFLYLQENQKNPLLRLIKIACIGTSEVMPLLSRKMLGISPAVNAKALALLSLSYLKLYKLAQNPAYLEKYQTCMDWLVSHNHASSEDSLGWGYPFDWQSLIFIPKETPLCVPTVLAGHAALDRWDIDARAEEERIARQVGNFLKKDLNKTIIKEDELCFSYSPLDQYQVINANLYTASYLIRYGRMFDDKEALELGEKARRFSINQQWENGAWPYWAEGYQPNTRPFIDNYHTGIVLQWLKVCADYAPETSGKFHTALDKGTAYYMDNLFTPEGIPKHTHDKVYPVDIHGPAQAFVTFNHLGDKVDLDKVAKVYSSTFDLLYSGKGTFYYRKYQHIPPAKIIYFRWAQAWMFYGLTHLLELTRSK